MRKLTPSTAWTSVRSRRSAPRRRWTVKVLRTASVSIAATSAARAPVVPHGDAPGDAGGERARERHRRPGELRGVRHAGRVVPAEEVEARQVGDEREREREGREAPEPGAED